MNPLVVATGAILAALLSLVARSAEPAKRSQYPCHLAEVERFALRDRQHDYYVNPRSFSVGNDGDLLIAGMPSYATGRVRARRAEANTLAGVIVSHQGALQAVPAPPQARRSTGLRAVPYGDGRWAFVFDERSAAADSVPLVNAPIRALWFGIYDRKRGWHGLERLPIPRNLSPRPITASLKGDGRQVWWTMPADLANGASGGVLLYTRARGAWRVETIPARGAAYSTIAFADSSNLLLAIVEPDRSLRQDQNSLFLYARLPAWHSVQKLAAGGPEPVHHPSVEIVRGDTVASWYSQGARGQQLGRMLLRGSQGAFRFAIDSVSATPVRLTRRAGETLWATAHAGDSSRVELRVTATTPRGVSRSLASTATPFVHHFEVLRADSSELLLTGPSPTPGAGGVVSVVQRLRLVCSQPVPRG